MAAPIRTPKPIVTRLNADINKVLSAPDVRQSFLAQGAEPLVMTLDQLNEFVKSETLKWSLAVKASGAKVD
jgi:tripartite-type tricarboxylate transporter receptor subunit TctC